MVFSSAPLYLDPHNWHHQQRQQAQLHHHHQQLTTHGGGGENPHHHQITVQMPPPAPSQAVGIIRPGSMADRARQAKMPQPEPGLKCPRCESTNTKFCYFNNYSLTQPRHFCKMCRRYWTKGGALRNVPVGGGCRRNKRSSKILSEEGASKTERQAGVNSTSPLSSNTNNTDMNNNNNSNNHGNMSDTCLPGQNFQPRLAQFSLLASLQGLAHGPPSSNLGLNFGGMMSTVAQAELGFEIGANSDQWRPHYFPNFLAAFDPLQVPHRPSSSSLYHFPIDHQNMDQQAAAKAPPRSSIASIPTNNSTDQQNDEAAAAVKSEEAASQGGMSRSFLGMSENSQYWATNNSSAWTDLSGLNSSTTRLL